MANSRVIKTIARAVGSTKGFYPQIRERLELLAHVHGLAALETDVEKWRNETGGTSISEYVWIADDRLKAENTPASQPKSEDVGQVSAAVFQLVGRTPSESVIQSYLEKYTKDEIIAGFKKGIDGLDEKEMRFSVKMYFQDGGLNGVILSMREAVEQRKQSEIEQQRAEEAGHALYLQEQAELNQQLQEKREAAKIAESNPDALFGG